MHNTIESAQIVGYVHSSIYHMIVTPRVSIGSNTCHETYIEFTSLVTCVTLTIDTCGVTSESRDIGYCAHTPQSGKTLYSTVLQWSIKEIAMCIRLRS